MKPHQAIKQAAQEVHKYRLGNQWVVSDYDGYTFAPVDYYRANAILQGCRLNRALLLLGIDEGERQAACYRRDCTGQDWRECVPVC